MSETELLASRLRIAPAIDFILLVPSKYCVREVPLRLAYDFNSLQIVEEKLGVNVLEHGEALFELPSAKVLLVLFWSSLLLYHDDEFAGVEGLELLGSLMSSANSESIRDAVKLAWLASSPEPKKRKRRVK